MKIEKLIAQLFCSRPLKFEKLSLAMLFFALLLMPVYAGQSTDTVKALVKIFSEWNGSSADKPALAEAADHIDYALMSERVLGPQRWSALSEMQKRDFITCFRTLIERRYYPRWRKIFRNASISYLDEKQISGDTLVKTQIKNGDSIQELVWTMGGPSSRQKVISLQVGERDLLKRAGQRFQKKLAKSNFSDFLAWIKKESVRATTAGIDEEEEKRQTPS